VYESEWFNAFFEMGQETLLEPHFLDFSGPLKKTSKQGLKLLLRQTSVFLLENNEGGIEKNKGDIEYVYNYVVQFFQDLYGLTLRYSTICLNNF
jgi:hypothetical protein